MNIHNLDEKTLENYLRDRNAEYRSGNPTISDTEYDQSMLAAAGLYPNNIWFNQLMVEPEDEVGKTVTLPERMLSTNKAYTHKEIEKWADDVVNVGKSLGLDEILFRVTPKLDGYASYNDNGKLYTRGDGRNGTDITRAFSRGLQSVLKFDRAAQGPGEIVVNKQYFVNHLSNFYENSRNIIASVIKEGKLDDNIKETIDDGMVVFYPFSELSAWIGNRNDLLTKLEELWDLFNDYDYDTDGLVIEAISKDIKAQMGNTNHHHKWQIAFKKNTEYHDIEVTGLVWQTSKVGRLTPVVQLVPTKVSGVTISKATGHNWGNIWQKRINTGAIVRVCRSGLVIPYIESVTKPAHDGVVYTPDHCPSCNSLTEIDGDNLLCTNTETCPAQIEGRIEYFFKTLGNCDGFGPKVIERICNYGSKTITSIYLSLCRLDFIDMGFGEKTADNLLDELEASRKRPIEDWRFLAAFSIHNVGKGGCEKLLQHHRLADIFNLSIADMIDIGGFADITATSLIKSLAKIKPDFDLLMALGFNLIETPLLTDSVQLTPISGLTIVFTGSMIHGKRPEMEKQAKQLGAKTSSAVSSNTDYLVCGSNVGEAKTKSAEKNNVKILTEEEYLTLIK